MTWTNSVSGINLTSVVITNLFGILLMGVLLLSKGWMARVKSNESKWVLLMIISVIAGCIIEPLTFIFDGIPGAANHIFLYIINSILFLLNIVVGPCYATLITSHINKKLSPIETNVIKVLCIIEIVMLFINIYFPIIFEINENNIYIRMKLFWLYIGIEAGMIFYGLIVFFIARMKGKMLKFFPAWQFIIPIIIGMLIQGSMYGVSVIWLSFGLAVCSIVICLQNENIFLDKLTGVYNRYFLDEIKKGLKTKSKGNIGAMMLDMNGFKSINDLYSHEEGDLALKNVASILRKVISSNGTIVRFAGDEFIILLKSSTKEELNSYKEAIIKSFDEYNSESGKPYKLSAAIGAELYDFKSGDVSDLLNSIDTLMYKDKEKYYKNHDRRSSRKNTEA
ncbi:MAG: GGDEF domain-containing protein [Lachnospiraceae bacterium]|nr:GGDEF domain-containing protein [Lachnospiraceae bacterium]